MAYRVKFSRRAVRDLDHLYGYIGASKSEAAELWFRGLEETISTLAIAPRAGFATREDPTARQLIYGNKPHLYRVIYRVFDAQEEVRVITIWHGKRQPPKPLVVS